MSPPPVPDLHAILTRLSSRRPVFHSEADFQHALAWELQQHDHAANIRLEKRISKDGPHVHLDLLVQSNSHELAIELKYKTRAVKLAHADEQYDLLNQHAQDIGRHDFIKGIRRLEDYVQDHPGSIGYAILLTNDRTYWSESRKTDAVDSAFRLHEGRVLQGEVTWGSKASAGTKHRRETPIALRGKYTLSWKGYSSHGEAHDKQFRYVMVRVPSDG
jgi:hypothetical protein